MTTEEAPKRRSRPTPYVSVMPGMKFGEPCINGHRLSTFMVAEHVYEGYGDSAEDTWDITRNEVLVACWYEARHGRSRRIKRAWRDWLAAYEGVLWHSTPEAWATVPLPPSEPSA